MAIEHNGDLYSCDHFVYPENRLGNIKDQKMKYLHVSEQQQQFGMAKKDALPQYCRDCKVLKLCNGGCPKDRIIKSPDGEPGLNYLCRGYNKFFMHSRPVWKKMANRLSNPS